MTNKEEGLLMKAFHICFMKTAFVPLFLTSVMVFSSLAGCVIDQNSSEAEAEVLAVFKNYAEHKHSGWGHDSFDASVLRNNSLT